MKKEAAAEVPVETPAGATKLWEPPVPIWSQLFCPEVTWKLEPSFPHSPVVASYEKLN